MNANLASDNSDIETLLAWTLDFDDFVDLESLKVTPEHPPFDPGHLGQPVAAVPDLVYPPEPEYVEPLAPKGLSGAFGGKKRHEEAIAQARAEYEQWQRGWHNEALKLHAAHLELIADRERHEAERQEKLAAAEVVYRAECAQRESDAASRNEELSKFINDLAFDVEYAIEDYVGIVLSNSVYPEALPVEHEHKFDLATRELTLQVESPGAEFTSDREGVSVRQGEG